MSSFRRNCPLWQEKMDDNSLERMENNFIHEIGGKWLWERERRRKKKPHGKLNFREDVVCHSFPPIYFCPWSNDDLVDTVWQNWEGWTRSSNNCAVCIFALNSTMAQIEATIIRSRCTKETRKRPWNWLYTNWLHTQIKDSF